MKSRLSFGDMTREEVRETAATTTVIFPTASIEQHGPHLPIKTDTEICEAVCRRAAEIAAAEVSVTVAPTLSFGLSQQHFRFPGVIALSTETFYRVVREVCESLARSGYRRIMIINGHGGNDAMIRQAGKDMAVELDVAIASASYWAIARQALIQEGHALDVGQVAGHAGGFETSCMMALRPDRVGPEARSPRRDPIQSSNMGKFDGLVVNEREKWGVDGCSDDARSASIENGQRFIAIIARELAKAIVYFSRA
ncbi:MAG: creatininase family protein [Chloroflexi bacterium]|nr:creatininase family protein [Chloroflexota bacterium]